VLIDGSPGIGCPVIASLANVDLAVVVVEPTLSGIHDLERAMGLLKHFAIKPCVVVNKFDLNESNTEAIDEYSKKTEAEILGHIPFDSTVTESMVAGIPVVDYAGWSPASTAITRIWDVFLNKLEL
jgi:MinD superfamily P-loop ATPase